LPRSNPIASKNARNDRTPLGLALGKKVDRPNIDVEYSAVKFAELPCWPRLAITTSTR
jgi:hypothetical protein